MEAKVNYIHDHGFHGLVLEGKGFTAGFAIIEPCRPFRFGSATDLGILGTRGSEFHTVTVVFGTLWVNGIPMHQGEIIKMNPDQIVELACKKPVGLHIEVDPVS